MKCLHCGTDLDRLSKLRGGAEYCSDECKRAAEEEFNQMALSRLTRLRPARGAARASQGEVREVRSGGETLTVVNYRPGATTVLVTEPPEAGFLLEVSSSLACLALHAPEPLDPAGPPACLPPPASHPASGADALRGLLSALRLRLRPAMRTRRAMETVCASWLQARGALATAPEWTGPDPVWPDHLGIDFQLLGLEDLVRPEEPPPAPFLTPVPHAAIPSRRGPRPLEAARFAPNVGEVALPGPVLSAPRLRIHLPRPALQPFRPRYGFAPAPAETPAVAAVEEVVAPVAEVVAPAEEVAAPEPVREPAVEAPSFGFAAAETAPAGAAKWRIMAAVVLVAAVGACIWWWTSRKPAAARPAAAAAVSKPALDPAVWIEVPAGDAAGIARSRKFTLFQPRTERADYRMEARAKIDQQAMGIVFRFRDSRNYYCWKIEPPAAGGTGPARLVSFAVIDGKEQPHRVASFAGPLGPEMRVELEARGPVFRLQIDGATADTWSDGRITTGTAGFSNESGERAVIASARVTD